MWKSQKVVGEQLGTVVPEEGDCGPNMGCHPPQVVDSEQQSLGLLLLLNRFRDKHPNGGSTPLSAIAF
jgi:hypothetical protein